jgi:hypothetical protein
VVPRRVESAKRVLKRSFGLTSGLGRLMKRLRKVGNVCRTANLDGGVDFPGIPAGRGNEVVKAYVA